MTLFKQRMFDLGVLYIQQLEDCTAGTETLEESAYTFSAISENGRSIIQSYITVITKMAKQPRQTAIKKSMNQQYAGSKFTTIVTTGKDAQAEEQE